ncbi:TIM barrel protein [Pedobacter sp. HMF7647]|uniref:TIM barrel protein n=1 Tax=Hufsiella arboris TaxID=2695275 RepID=A0A7K1Y9X0_9SPHI|nr:sugar phosphate isomerase/epimerase [Hufsiella arboris]MXV50858.1 TIM barrel protein [Hufsiella arboris]
MNRRRFITTTGFIAGNVLLSNEIVKAANFLSKSRKVKISGHIWVYASKFPPEWDSTPVIEQAFSDFQYAGLDGLELMEVNLRHDDAVSRLSELAEKYKVPVTGTSYNGAMWNSSKHSEILDDVALVVDRLHQLKGSTFGVSVGDAQRLKTEKELDAQADLLLKLIKICEDHGVILNLHNHTYEVVNGMHDLKGTLARIPDIKLGPDLNWLVRGGVDPVEFINTYGKQIVYMHIRDQTADGKWTETVGTGTIDFKAIAKALNEQNYKGRAAVELAFDSPPVNPIKEDWKNSLQYVKNTFGWA